MSAVASVVAGMEAMMHLGRRLAKPVGAELCCARAERCARVPGSRVVEWRERARVHAVRAGDWDTPSPNDLT